MRLKRLAIRWAVAVCATAAGAALAGGGPQNVLLVVHGQSQSSLEIANHYQQLRNLPEDNVLYLAPSNTAALHSGGDLRRVMTGGVFRTNVLWPVLNYLRVRGLTNQIDYILYSTDIPTQIDVRSEPGASNSIIGLAYFSLTAMTAFGDLIEPVNTASNLSGNVMQCFRGFTYLTNSPATFTTNVTHATVWAAGSPARRYYNSTVLGWTHWFGNTTDELKSYLQRSRAADGTRPAGTVYLDANVDVRGTTRSNQFIATSNELATLGVASSIVVGNPSPYSIVNRPDILGAVMGAAAPLVPAGSTYLPGSIAESLTSFSGILDNAGIGQFRLSQHLGVGVAGTSGTITEPYAVSAKFPAARMHAHYARGATLGEAFSLSVQTPYHLLVMGDALCRPHAIIPGVTLSGLSEGSVVSNTITLFPSATTTSSNGIAGYELFVDGLLRQGISFGGSVNLNTATLADGWHEARVVAYENSAVRTQGDVTRNFRVNNFDQQIQAGSTNLTATVGGPNVSFTVSATGGSPSAIEIRRGQQLLTTVTGATGTASIALTNLGPGRSVLRAMAAMSSGLVRSAPIVVNVNRPSDTTPPQLGRYYTQMGTNNTLGGLRSKAAYKNSDYVYFNLVPTEPVGLTNARVTVGGGTVAPFPIRWAGMSTTNTVPNTAGLTNPMTFRYQLVSTRDPEGQLPVQISLTDGAGLTTVTNTFIATDYTLPIVTQAVVLPAYASPGVTAKIKISAGEILSPPPEVYVGGAAAAFVSSNGNFYNYSFTVPAGTPPGLLGISASNVLDLAENSYDSLSDSDDFEAKSVGSNLTNDARWTAIPSATNSAAIYVTNSPAAAGSTHSAVFKDASGATNQSCWFNFPSPRYVAVVDFDLYLDNRNSASNAAFTVRASIGTNSLREVDLVFAQTSSTNFRVGVASLVGTTFYTGNQPVQTWHHVRFVNDVLNNKFTLAFNGVTVASNVTYFSPFTSVTNVGNLQFVSTSADEDVYIDNLVVTDVMTFLNVSDDSDGDGLPDAWELRHFPSLASTSGAADSDGDGQTDLYEFLAGTSPVATNAAAPPSFDAIASVTVLEDAGQQTIPLTGISGIGPVLLLAATSSDTNIVPHPTIGYASPDVTGTLNFTPATNANGTVTLTVVLSESGSPARTTNQFTVTILPVNDAPTFGFDTNAGMIWTPQVGAGRHGWFSVASSADGAKLVALDNNNGAGGQIYTSTDSGVTWTARESNRTWKAVSSSSDGTKLVAAVVGGQIYTSTDSGVTWTARESSRRWFSVASSADGSKLAAVDYGGGSGGKIYLSSDSGTNWTARESNRSWHSVSSSSDGAKLVAVVFGGQIYTSTDAGMTWIARESLRNWISVGSSVDGTMLVAVDYLGVVAKGGQIYTSTDSGVSWTVRESNRYWFSVASSADGSKLVAGVRSGQIYTSTDYGVTWTARENNRNWFSVSSSADGAKLVAVVNDGQIYTSMPFSSTLVLNEDASTQTVNLIGITSGPANESTQSLTVTATSSDTSVIPNPVVTYTSPDTTGSLTFAPATNASGTATITVIVSDDGGTVNGGINALTNTFLVTVNPVNDAPTFAPLADLTILENSVAQTVALSNITSGATNESQVLTVTASASDTALIPTLTVNYTSPATGGSLQFVPATNATGTATITVIVRDDGGTANGGMDAVTNQFVVTVQSATPPTLAVSRAASGFNLFWPSNAAGFSLQFSENLAAWFLETNPPPMTNGVLTFTNAPAPGQRFYRLIRP